ncbi:MAG: DUF192 domain-containing protein [Eubacteriales bacterium]|nr:DUF192 domain-containing protein [Eubacteriales bacterium]MDD4323446.1 DUF192 domain-containing protein [Eubacteriales bacterium]MDD4540699.1 DUF192 domain-containing protein [Eubacteriales bacterium]
MSKRYVLYNVSKNQIVLDNMKVAATLGKRLRGLIGQKKLDKSSGMMIKPCNGIHSCFMSIPIDALFIDRDFRVIKKIENFRPWSFSPIVSKSAAVIEGAAGAFDSVDTGDTLSMESGSRVS